MRAIKRFFYNYGWAIVTPLLIIALVLHGGEDVFSSPSIIASKADDEVSKDVEDHMQLVKAYLTSPTELYEARIKEHYANVLKDNRKLIYLVKGSNACDKKDDEPKFGVGFKSVMHHEAQLICFNLLRKK